MAEEFKPRAPDYSGDGVAIWKATDSQQRLFLKVSVLKGKPINCFKVEERKEPEVVKPVEAPNPEDLI